MNSTSSHTPLEAYVNEREFCEVSSVSDHRHWTLTLSKSSTSFQHVLLLLVEAKSFNEVYRNLPTRWIKDRKLTRQNPFMISCPVSMLHWFDKAFPMLPHESGIPWFIQLFLSECVTPLRVHISYMYKCTCMSCKKELYYQHVCNQCSAPRGSLKLLRDPKSIWFLLLITNPPQIIPHLSQINTNLHLSGLHQHVRNPL